MSTFNPGGRRSLDGPGMRVRQMPPAGPSVSVPEIAMAVDSDSSVAPATEVPLAAAPTFEYRKPYSRTNRPRRNWWRYARVLAVVIVLGAVATGGLVVFKGFGALHGIIARSNGGAPALAGLLDPTKLKGEGDGRVNVLVLGIGGQGHEAPTLSDTILILSIDPKTKDAAMLSVPRDLYVKIPGNGYGKINSANAYGGPELASKVVSSVVGVPIHYYVQIDFSGFKQAVDAVGGIDVTVPTSVNDPEYPCDNEHGGICPFHIAAGSTHMNGITALRYARSRKSTSDFDRAARQQLIIAALKKQATQVSTLSNPVKLIGLIDTIGGHVKTDMQAGEIKKLAAIAKDLDTSKMTQRVLSTEGDDPLLIDGSGRIAGAGSIELPKAGNFDYSDIQDFVKNIFVDHYLTDEKALIEVQNGSEAPGLAAAVATSLEAAHYRLMEPANSAVKYPKTIIYDYTGGKKPYTINYLERRFGVKAQKATAPSPTPDAAGKPAQVPEIRIILGSNYQSGASGS